MLRGAYLDTISAEGAGGDLGSPPATSHEMLRFVSAQACFWDPFGSFERETRGGVVDNSYRGQNSNMHMCEAP